LIASILGCGQGNDRLIEKARLEGKEAAEAGINSQNENLASRASTMEADLTRRHRFFQAVAGTYEGTMPTDSGAFNIRLTLVPSLPPTPTSRVRPIEEITHDLTNLYFNVQIVQWNPSTPLSAVGCRIESVRPDIVNGTIQIASVNCPNFYAFELSDAGAPESNARALAQGVTEGNLSNVSAVRGEVRPTSNATVFTFSAAKVSK
jgi:hypothetical protein